MNAQWKPGDVALVNDTTGVDSWLVAVCRTGGSIGNAKWLTPKGEVWSSVSEARPLVVIDPDDAEQVKRFDDLLSRFVEGDEIPDYEGTEGATRAALREFANPPKLEEPQGLGAVVEDAEGADWHRTRDGRWIAEDGLRSRAAGWVHINAVRALSEGVTA